MSHDVLLEGVWFVWVSPVPGPSGTNSDSEQDVYEFRDANGFKRTVVGTRERIVAGDVAELSEAYAAHPMDAPVPDPEPEPVSPEAPDAPQPSPEPPPVSGASPEPEPPTPPVEPDALAEPTAEPQ